MIDKEIIQEFHAHIYYEEDTKQIAEELYNYIDENIMHSICGVLGKFHNEPIGPHTKPMFTISEIGIEQSFLDLVKWLMLNRQGLSVLIHPVTNKGDIFDHTHMLWLGTPVPLDLEKL